MIEIFNTDRSIRVCCGFKQQSFGMCVACMKYFDHDTLQGLIINVFYHAVEYSGESVHLIPE